MSFLAKARAKAATRGPIRSFPAGVLTIRATDRLALELRRVPIRGPLAGLTVRSKACLAVLLIQAIDRLERRFRLVLAIRLRQARGRNPRRLGNAGNTKAIGGFMKNLLMTAAVLAAVGASPAHATLQITVSANGASFTCSDGQVGCDFSPSANNLLVINTSVGGSFVELILAQSTFDPGRDELQLSSSAISNTTGAPITINIAASDSGFLPPVNTINESASLTFNNAVGSGPSSLAFLASQSNVKFVGQSLFTTSGTPTTDPDSFAGTHSSPFDSLTPFSMTEAASLNLAAGADITGLNMAMETGAIPEPSTWVMAGLGFAVMAGFAWRRRAHETLAV